MVDSVPAWWHSIDVGDGVITPGRKTPDVHVAELQALQLPDLEGKTVLDIGAWDGFYSFHCERAGAARVVALDWLAWLLEDAAGPPPHTPDPEGLPGRRGFEVARGLLGSRVEPVAADFMDADLDSLGTFDVVLFLGVLYHLEDPLGALRRLRQVTGELAVIETHAVVVPGLEKCALWEHYPGPELGSDPTNWWGPNVEGLLAACHAAGFERAEVVWKSDVREAGNGLGRYRLVAHVA